MIQDRILVGINVDFDFKVKIHALTSACVSKMCCWFKKFQIGSCELNDFINLQFSSIICFPGNCIFYLF